MVLCSLSGSRVFKSIKFYFFFFLTRWSYLLPLAFSQSLFSSYHQQGVWKSCWWTDFSDPEYNSVFVGGSERGSMLLAELLQAPCQDSQSQALQGVVILVVFSVCPATQPFSFCLWMPQLKNTTFFVLAWGSDASERQEGDNPTPTVMQRFLTC